MGHKISEVNAWQDQTHAEVFDYLGAMPNLIVRKHYESFNEGRLLKEFQACIRGNKFFEIGCATGELHRYIRHYQKRFEYYGFDISKPAILRAKAKYPKGRFYQITCSPEEIGRNFGRPNVVWCRDVVLHQRKPFEFLDELIELTDSALLLRLRTRDVGDTVLDCEVSCQLHWDNHWVPYIVLNTDEMIQRISAHSDVNQIVVARAYEVLGGHNYRYLPKELYFSSSKSAETAVLICKGPRKNGSVDVLYRDQTDRPRYTVIEHVVRKLYSRIRSGHW